MEFNEAMAALVEEWNSRWARQRVRDFPSLYRFEKDGRTIVCDTRESTKKEHVLSDTDKALLDVIQRPMSTNEIKASLPEADQHLVERALVGLERKSLILQENGDCVNLVVADDKFEQITYLLSHEWRKMS